MSLALDEKNRPFPLQDKGKLQQSVCLETMYCEKLRSPDGKPVSLRDYTGISRTILRQLSEVLRYYAFGSYYATKLCRDFFFVFLLLLVTFNSYTIHANTTCSFLGVLGIFDRSTRIKVGVEETTVQGSLVVHLPHGAVRGIT